jgi:hypothetical protein
MAEMTVVAGMLLREMWVVCRWLFRDASSAMHISEVLM